MDSSSSQRIRSESGPRPVMPVEILIPAIEGNIDALITRLGLEPKEQTESQVIQSATDFGDTLLHILIIKRHNELALKIFRREMSLLLAQNKMSETPLHYAAKVGNDEVIRNLIENGPAVVVEALEKTNKDGETALQIAAKYGNEGVVRQLLDFGLRESREMKSKRLSLLNMAIVEGYTSMVQKMLEIEPSLAYAQLPDGTFPIHVATRKGNMDLIRHFTEVYHHCVELLDPHGRNLFHIGAEENHEDLFGDILIRCANVELINARDFKGNTPLHIAAMKGHRSIMRAIWKNKKNDFAETVRNNEGLTPLELSARQLKAIKDIDSTKISNYIKTKDYKFTLTWFDKVMEPSRYLPFKDIWETAQFMGLGSVLITTVTFTAAFTIPGGYNQDHGTPVLGRKYAFRAFILANSLAFIQGFASLITIILNSSNFVGELGRCIPFVLYLMVNATNCMVLAFGFGLYVTLAPVSMPIAILLLVIFLFFGSCGNGLITYAEYNFDKMVYSVLNSKKGANPFLKYSCCVMASNVVGIVFVFCLALL